MGMKEKDRNIGGQRHADSPGRNTVIARASGDAGSQSIQVRRVHPDFLIERGFIPPSEGKEKHTKSQWYEIMPKGYP